MRFFFKSRQFKIIVITFIILVAVTAIFAAVGKHMSPQTDIAGTIAAPIRKAYAFVADSVSDFFKTYNNNNSLSLENAELKSQIDELRAQIADYDEIAARNEFYKNYLEIKDDNPDFKFTHANLISRDNDDPFCSFVINEGSLSDIEKYDPVITEAGIVGYISEVGLTSSKVTTILSPDITLGAIDGRTSDSGIITGTLTLAENGLCKFSNLSRSCSVAVSDYVVTSGEGIFPEGLLVGEIKKIVVDEYNVSSIYAEVEPFVNINEIKGVMVITSFEGQGGITVNSEDN